MAIALATLGVCLTYFPWLPTLFSHLSRPETDWLKLQESNWVDAIAPLYQIPLGWILMVVAFPVELQPAWMAILSGALMLLFSGWLLWQISSRFGQLWSTPETHMATRMLVIFVLVVLLEFLGIIYFLGKDITLVPRYNFIYFPGVCALLGASLAQEPEARSQKSEVRSPSKLKTQNSKRLFPIPHSLLPTPHLLTSVLMVGFISSVLVVSNQVFLKPYHPDRVAQQMRIDPEISVFVGMGYSDFQDVALGLSFGLALRDQTITQPNRKSEDYFTFLGRSSGYTQAFQSLSQKKPPLPLPFNFWLVAPGLKRVEFPVNLFFAGDSGKQQCEIDPTHYHRLGIPYQMYRCGK
ncbi:hypothetical protein K9N68_14300 [Kovacikia minuta CCNUW1]|uniref:hypothetical protein n=1 Tax=Kovacikia minuta TaxID=2931930 RepID=UPI001CCA497D|nr:hypothetical protein [Kovacikia minuta]UBF28902.1 hypothetical protein K9N68_14300 [Kovacikia minuta CCNUW1]